MQLARVIGTVVATVKNESLHGRKLLVVQTLDRHLKESGKPMVAVDSVGAGLASWCFGVEVRKQVFPSNAKTRRLTAPSLESLIRKSM